MWLPSIPKMDVATKTDSMTGVLPFAMLARQVEMKLMGERGELGMEQVWQVRSSHLNLFVCLISSKSLRSLRMVK